MKRHEVAEQVAVLAGPIAARMGLELVDVEWVGGGGHQILRVLVDRDGRAGVEDCARLSEALSRELDLYDLLAHSYTLEVASPGLDRPLRRLPDFVRFSGRTAAVTTVVPHDGQRRFRGRLLGLVDGRVSLLLEDGREIRLAEEEIAQAKLVVEMSDLREDFRRSRAASASPSRTASGGSAQGEGAPEGERGGPAKGHPERWG
ncbi:MAG TPA: ribosome maturation factor RimP [bacterium]|nr:ribosome maturation factor RimP [bacterium]